MSEEFTMGHEETIRKWDEKIKEIIKLDYDINKCVNILAINNENHKLTHDIIELQKSEDKEKIALLVKKIALNCILEKTNEYACSLGDINLLLSSLTVISKEKIETEDPNKYIDIVINKNRELMIDKNKNYGSSWSIMRPIGIADIIHVKIHRIDSLISGEKNNFESINDSLEDILNYCIFLLIMMEKEK